MVTWLAIAAPAILGGCASTAPKDPFAATAKAVKARTGKQISWNQGGDEDAAVERHVRELLAHELTVDGAIQVALLNNRALQATYEELSIAQADLVQAGLLQNPVFGAGLAFPLTGNVRTGFDLSVSQDFLGIFTLAARKKIARAELEAATLKVGSAVLQTTFEVASAFYAVTSAAQVASMRRTIVEAGDATFDLARRRYDAGNISDLDLANEEALTEQLRTELFKSEADAVVARENLTRRLGLWGAASTAYRVAEKLPELPEKEVELERLESLAVGRRLDLGAVHAEVEAASRAAKMARALRWTGAPQVGATYERAPEHYSVIGPNASLEVPLFDQKQAIVAKAEARHRAAVAREIALAVDIRSEVRVARERVRATRLVVERSAKIIVPLRERVVALTEEQYSAMLVGAPALLLAKQNEISAYRELIEALRDYWIARAELDRATGGTVTTHASGAKHE